MMNLSSYIEKLLLDNDCVIIPEIGGFIAQTISATYDRKQQLFIPPMRTVGFNAKLTLNDGLLIYAVMREEDISYDKAVKVVKEMSKEVLASLHENGSIHFANVGTLRLNIQNGFEFTPEFKIATPAQTGFTSFQMTPLAEMVSNTTTTVRVDSQKDQYEIHVNRTFIHSLTAIAAAIILLFIMSTPVKNTYVESGNYAQLMPVDLFQRIEGHSMNVTPVLKTSVRNIIHKSDACQQTIKETAEDSLKRIKTKEIKVEQAQKVKATPVSPKETSSKVISGPYHLIVAGGVTESKADKLVEDLKTKGHAQAVKLMSSADKYRVSIQSYRDRETAEHELVELRKNPSFKDAWLLVKRH